MTDPKRGIDLQAKLFAMKNLPCAPDPEPDVDKIDYVELAIEITGPRGWTRSSSMVCRWKLGRAGCFREALLNSHPAVVVGASLNRPGNRGGPLGYTPVCD